MRGAPARRPGCPARCADRPCRPGEARWRAPRGTRVPWTLPPSGYGSRSLWPWLVPRFHITMPARHVFEALTRDIDARQPSEARVRGADPEQGLRDAARGLLGHEPTRYRGGYRGPATGGLGSHL